MSIEFCCLQPKKTCYKRKLDCINVKRSSRSSGTSRKGNLGLETLGCFKAGEIFLIYGDPRGISRGLHATTEALSSSQHSWAILLRSASDLRRQRKLQFRDRKRPASSSTGGARLPAGTRCPQRSSKRPRLVSSISGANRRITDLVVSLEASQSLCTCLTFHVHYDMLL